MNLLRLFDRDASRERQDSTAPLAQPVAELRTAHPGREYLGPETAGARLNAMFRAMEEDLDPPIVTSLAALRACRPDAGIPRPDPIEVARMVETVARRTYESATGLEWAGATTRVRKRVRDGVRVGMQEVGVIRC